MLGGSVIIVVEDLALLLCVLNIDGLHGLSDSVGHSCHHWSRRQVHLLVVRRCKHVQGRIAIDFLLNVRGSTRQQKSFYDTFMPLVTGHVQGGFSMGVHRVDTRVHFANQ